MNAGVAKPLPGGKYGMSASDCVFEVGKSLFVLSCYVLYMLFWITIYGIALYAVIVMLPIIFLYSMIFGFFMACIK